MFTNQAIFAGASLALGLPMLFSFAPSVQATTLTFSGNTTGAPTWNRPSASALNVVSGLSGTTAVPYNVQAFTVDTAGNYNFLSTSTTSGFNNNTFLYQGGFNPASPLTNVVIGNNNFPTTSLSGFNNVALTANVNYFFVTTGSLNNDFGSYTNTISNAFPGNPTITSVPEPATILGTLAAFGFGVYSKRKVKLTQDRSLSTSDNC
jgi:hypothetical protein